MKQLNPIYCKKLRNNKVEIPSAPFEKQYFITYTFKQAYKKCEDRNILVNRLQYLATLKISENKQSYWKMRNKTHGCRKLCFICRDNFSICQHHIILLKNGGYDNGINRIPVCEDCHKLIHPWMENIGK